MLSARCPWLLANSSGTLLVALVVPLATSAMKNSLPFGKSMRQPATALQVPSVDWSEKAIRYPRCQYWAYARRATVLCLTEAPFASLATPRAAHRARVSHRITLRRSEAHF